MQTSTPLLLGAGTCLSVHKATDFTYLKVYCTWINPRLNYLWLSPPSVVVEMVQNSTFQYFLHIQHLFIHIQHLYVFSINIY